VAWSETQGGTKRTVGAVVGVPAGLVAAGASVILAEVHYTYTSPAGELIYGSIPLSETFYQKPRKVAAVTRSS
jgi:hypothetical protein